MSESTKTPPKTEPPRGDDPAPRNLWVLAWHSVSLRCGWIFKTESVVMPAVVDILGGAAGSAGWVRGLLPMLNKFGQSVPPLLAADAIRKLRLKRRALMLTSGSMAIVFSGISFLWLVRGELPKSAALLVFLALYAVFFAAVGLNGLAYNTVQGKLIPPARRGRLLGIGSVIGSLGAISLAWWLMPGWLAWPDATGFVPIFLTSAAGYAIASSLCLLLRETPSAVAETQPRRPFAAVGQLLRSDKRFRLTAVVAALATSSQLLFPHYQWIGREMLNADLGSLFDWVLAQNFTVAILGPLAGGIGDRFGNRLAVRITIALSILPPVVAAALVWLSKSGVTEAADWFWVVFALLGLTPVTVKTIMNYTLELAPMDKHPAYLSSMQTCFAIPFVLSPLAGLLVDATVDRAIGVTCLIALIVSALLIAFLLTFRMQEVRHQAEATHGQS